jgi:hypothetical protein
MPSISLGQSAAGAGGAAGVLDAAGGGGVGSVEVGLVPLLLVVILSVLLSPCGVIWANAPAATVRVRAKIRPIAPANTFIAFTPSRLTLRRKTLA